ncbi:type III polyketide synthase [Lottiidibacillus patelloidae]|uniref:Type III polyketide synthase n=1 Tax=Lottiidibacillus patelloidae TaxID=2670334 RepID=A0A263BUT7_9BACI|nr:3-oxoacyl-[acyl-carrier-protein] synthase III C-terminal domain-containing protein [Lottiidibacillus patelloidae]OZM57470.1 type III polyketide synthase [Lottiidibacillus patelloidae]
MPFITSVAHANLPYALKQEEALSFAKTMFSDRFEDIDRLLSIFHNGQIRTRYFCMPFEWYKEPHTFEEKNNAYIEHATKLSIEAVKSCLENKSFLEQSVDYDEIDAIFFISTTGLATPTIDVKIINALPFSRHVKRIPIWGLGCAGGTAGIARAMDYCKAYPKANVLVITVELCSLTFQRNDKSKSNLVGSSLFADGVACTLVSGTEAKTLRKVATSNLFEIINTRSTLKPDSEDVMGWDVKNEGLFVVFSKSIPNLVKNWFSENVDEFLDSNMVTQKDISHFIAHPGGKKVLDAYEEALQLQPNMTDISRFVLEEYGNMSSTTVIFVLEETMKKGIKDGELGLMTSLGPGFSSELALLKGTRKESV